MCVVESGRRGRVCDYPSSQEMSATVCTWLFSDPIIAACSSTGASLQRSRWGCSRRRNAGRAGDPDYERLVGMLTARSPEFRDFWHQARSVSVHYDSQTDPSSAGGPHVFEYNSLTADDQSGAKLVVYTPLKKTYNRRR